MPCLIIRSSFWMHHSSFTQTEGHWKTKELGLTMNSVITLMTSHNTEGHWRIKTNCMKCSHSKSYDSLMHGARFRQKFTLEDAIGSHACSLEANIEANTRVTNGIPLGSSLLLPVDTVNCVQTLKACGAVLLRLHNITSLIMGAYLQTVVTYGATPLCMLIYLCTNSLKEAADGGAFPRMCAKLGEWKFRYDLWQYTHSTAYGALGFGQAACHCFGIWSSRLPLLWDLVKPLAIALCTRMRRGRRRRGAFAAINGTMLLKEGRARRLTASINGRANKIPLHSLIVTSSV
jgi:hypothetical protein